MADLKTMVRALAGPLEVEARRGYRDTAIIGQSLGRYVRGWAENVEAAFTGSAGPPTCDPPGGRGKEEPPAPRSVGGVGGADATLRSGKAPSLRSTSHAPSLVGQLRELLGEYGELGTEVREQRVKAAGRLLARLLRVAQAPSLRAPLREGAGSPPPTPTPAGTVAAGERPRTRPPRSAGPPTCDPEGRAGTPRPPKQKPTVAPSPPVGQELASCPGTPAPQAVVDLLDQSVAGERKPTPAWAQRLANLGLHTNRDLLYHVPRDYLPLRRLGEVADGERAAVLVQAGAREESVLREARGFRLMRYVLDVSDALPAPAAQVPRPATPTDSARVFSVARLPRRGARAQVIANSPLALSYSQGARLLIEGTVRRAGQLIEIQYGGSERVGDGPSGPRAGPSGSPRGEGLTPGALVPVYPLTEGVYQGQVRSAIRRLLDKLPGDLDDPLPRSLRQRHHLPSLARALWDIHWPSSQEARDAARRRLAFEELLVLELAMAQRKRERQIPATGLRMPPKGDVIGALAQVLPFSLTRAQQRVIAEITADMASDIPMYRLLQGDVGSGKTVVAAAALVIATQNGYQGALMAPTEILAEQHYLVLSELLQPLGVPVALLTGSVRGPERDHALDVIRAGRPTVVVGTHALIQEGVEFGRLGLVIVDEQHRFGVRQRAELLTKGASPDRGSPVAQVPRPATRTAGRSGLGRRPEAGKSRPGGGGIGAPDPALGSGAPREGAGSAPPTPPRPHMLVMTATPIPRSLALTLYGDLDLSVLDEMPPGRQEVKTRWHPLPGRGRGSAPLLAPSAVEGTSPCRAGAASGSGPASEAFALVRRQVGEGGQAYVVCPLIEESEELQAEAATKVAEELQQGDFSDLRVGLLHGAMRVGEREAVMAAFRAGDLDVLTATTVIEVGVDVPKATIMMILNAERFGLAQLHQLRGRVGRGGHQSYCLLLTPARYDPTGRIAPAGEEAVGLARRRLQVMVETNDGFAIAEQDLLIRGPGELYGARQHGLPDFRLARLAGDLGVLTEAREAAFALVEGDPELKASEHRGLRGQVEELRGRMERLAG